MNGREMSRQTSAKQTNAQTKLVYQANRSLKVQEDARYPSIKSSLKSNGNDFNGRQIAATHRGDKSPRLH